MRRTGFAPIARRAASHRNWASFFGTGAVVVSPVTLSLVKTNIASWIVNTQITGPDHHPAKAANTREEALGEPEEIAGSGGSRGHDTYPAVATTVGRRT
jgi:hypothetical protein